MPQRPPSPGDKSVLALGFEWAGKIVTVALEMVLPGLAGHYLDLRLQTRFLAIFGFFLGFALGMFHLLAMTGSFRRPAKKP